LVPFQVDAPADVTFHPFLFQKPLLFILSLKPPQRDPPFPIDHPVPGQFFIPGAGMKDPCDLPGSSGIARQRGDLAIGGNPAFGYGPDASDDLKDEWMSGHDNP
jgi:hypothetical protein